MPDAGPPPGAAESAAAAVPTLHAAPLDVARLGQAVLPLLAVGLAALVYLPVATAYFYADDFLSLLRIEDQGFVGFVFPVFGGHILVVRNLLFYLWARLFDFSPGPFYWTVLLTHLLDVWLLFRVSRRLTGSAPAATLSAALWGTSPLCAGTLEWYSVYGQVLVATILLVLLERITRSADAAAPPSARTVVAWGLLSLVAATCFGVGVGIGMVLPAVMLLLVPGIRRRRGALLACLGVSLATVGFYFGYRRLWGSVVPLPLSEVVLVNFAVSRYLPIVRMLGHLVAVGIAGLLRGVYFVPTAYPDAASRLAVVLFGAAVAAALLAGDDATRRRLLAMLVLCLGAYGIIAVGRANFSVVSNMALEVSARQLRYHYVGILPLAMIVGLVTAALGRRLPVPGLLPGALLAAWLAAWAYGFAHRGVRIDRHPEVRRAVATAAQALEAAIDAAPPGADVELPNRALPPEMMPRFAGPAELPGWAALFVLLHPDDVVRGHRVRFIEHDPAVLAAARQGRRLAGLVVPPGAVHGR